MLESDENYHWFKDGTITVRCHYFRDHRTDKPKKFKKDQKLSKLINNSDSDTGNDSEHELSYYIEDRVKLMKEVLKIIKPRKIKSMAPDCMKKMQIEEINSMLLEELLGISKKRLKYIFEGKSLDEESSTDEDQPVDVISLDDISDDDFVIISDEETDKNKKKKRRKIKEEFKEKSKKIKKEKPDREKEKDKTKDKEKEKGTREKEPMGEENLMSVLELLELQARARAIRSQLDLENKRKKEEQERLAKEQAEKSQENEQDDDEDIIIEIPKEVEIIITSSDSENETLKPKGKNKASTSKRATSSTNRTNSKMLDNNVNEKTDYIHVPISEGLTQKDTTNNSPIINKEKINNEKSVITNITSPEKAVDGENEGSNKDPSEAHEKEKFDKIQLSSIPVSNERRVKSDKNMEENRVPNKDISSNSSNLDSDSSDNLQVIMLRERKKKKKAFEKSSTSTDKNDTTESVETENDPPENVLILKDSGVEDDKNPNKHESANKNTEDSKQFDRNLDQSKDNATWNDGSDSQKITNKSGTNDSHLQNEDNDSQQGGSKIEYAIAEFMKTQPSPSDKTEELKKLEEVKKNEEKVKQTKQKRLKNLKNKLQSYKKDVEGESSVTILENIVIKPKTANHGKSRNRVAEDSDDLVINVDQDDLDCIVCD